MGCDLQIDPKTGYSVDFLSYIASYKIAYDFSFKKNHSYVDAMNSFIASKNKYSIQLYEEYCRPHSHPDVSRLDELVIALRQIDTPTEENNSKFNMIYDGLRKIILDSE